MPPSIVADVGTDEIRVDRLSGVNGLFPMQCLPPCPLIAASVPQSTCFIYLDDYLKYQNVIFITSGQSMLFRLPWIYVSLPSQHPGETALEN